VPVPVPERRGVRLIGETHQFPKVVEKRWDSVGDLGVKLQGLRGSAWPSWAITQRGDRPAASASVANVRRSVCGVNGGISMRPNSALSRFVRSRSDRNMRRVHLEEQIQLQAGARWSDYDPHYGGVGLHIPFSGSVYTCTSGCVVRILDSGNLGSVTAGPCVFVNGVDTFSGASPNYPYGRSRSTLFPPGPDMAILRPLNGDVFAKRIWVGPFSPNWRYQTA